MKKHRFKKSYTYLFSFYYHLESLSELAVLYPQFSITSIYSNSKFVKVKLQYSVMPATFCKTMGAAFANRSINRLCRTNAPCSFLAIVFIFDSTRHWFQEQGTTDTKRVQSACQYDKICSRFTECEQFIGFLPLVGKAHAYVST